MNGGPVDRFAMLLAATRRHRQEHGCGAYAFQDGPGLGDLAARTGARRILELGTALGYTACHLAAASPETRVVTVEGDPLHARLAREAIAAHHLSAQIDVVEGRFDEVLDGLTGRFDLAFFDGFAPDPGILAALADRVGPGGHLVCANLGLAHNGGRRTLDRFTPPRWTALPPLESGATAVFRRMA